jgi:hypothetical protein
MAKRRAKKTSAPHSTAKKLDAAGRLREALTKRTKAELIDFLTEFAGEDRDLLRRLSASIDLETPTDEIVATTRQAIADATYFDKRNINYNFDYDYAAYAELKRNLGRLIDLDEMRLAMELSLELMKQGSYQVEMSDEGLMTEDIEQCIGVVVQALTKSALPPDEVLAWCAAMSKSDRLGLIYDWELAALRKHAEASRPQ